MQEEGALNAAFVRPVAAGAGRGLLGRAFDRWKRVAHAIGVVQTRFLMLAIYVTVVVPTGVFFRLSRDPLHLRPPKDTNWVPVQKKERSLDAARQQF